MTSSVMHSKMIVYEVRNVVSSGYVINVHKTFTCNNVVVNMRLRDLRKNISSK